MKMQLMRDMGYCKFFLNTDILFLAIYRAVRIGYMAAGDEVSQGSVGKSCTSVTEDNRTGNDAWSSCKGERGKCSKHFVLLPLSKTK